jgi:hypothetical protein
MPNNPVLLKLEWANKRFMELDRLVRDFASRAQPIVIERDGETGELLYLLATDPVIDPSIPLLAGDPMQNLRTALDYLAYALVVANGKKPHSGTYFPISKNAPGTKGYDESFAGKVRGMSEDAIGLIERLKPYKGGDHYLWRIHELNNREKHRLLFTVGAYVCNFNATQHIEATDPPLEDIERLARAVTSDEVWAEIRQMSYPLKARDILFIDRPNAKPNHNAQFFIQIALNEAGVFEGEPLMHVAFGCFCRVAEYIRRFRGMY